MRQKDFYHAILSEKIAYAEIDMENRRIFDAGGLWSTYVDHDKDYEQILLQHKDSLVHPEDVQSYAQFISEKTMRGIMSRQKDTGSLQFRRLIDGEMRWVELTGHVFQDRVTGNVFSLLYMQDIDAQKRREMQQAIAATRDPLTTVYNRNAFEQEVTDYVLRSEDSAGGTLIILDLDNFKQINDTFGHSEGDLVLRQMADVLLSTFRRKDLIGRFGSDEFLIFLKGTRDKQVIDRRIREMCNTLAAMNQHNCTCSIGITFANPKDFHYDACLKQADIALYESKKQGKNRHSYFEDIL